jgi:hypothetical protein
MFRVIFSLFLMIILLSSIVGCSQEIKDKFCWQESGGFFITIDAERAQKEIPFTLVLPTYIPPDKRNIIPPPNIKGLLPQFRENNEVNITILYSIKYQDDSYRVIIIDEYNYPLIFPDPEDDPELEYINIAGIHVIQDKNQKPIHFYFNGNGIYFVVESNDMPYEDAFRMVDSMIKQLK